MCNRSSFPVSCVVWVKSCAGKAPTQAGLPLTRSLNLHGDGHGVGDDVMRLVMRLVIKMGMIGDETGDGVPRTCRHVVVWETRPTKTRGDVFCICLPQLCAVHALLIVYHLMFGCRFKKSSLFCSREWQLHNRNQIAWKWNLRRWLILQGAQSVSNPATWIFELHPIASLTATWGSDAVAGRWEEGSRCHIKSAPHLCLYCFVQFKRDINYQFEFHLNLDSWVSLVDQMIESLQSLDDNTNFSIFYFYFESASSHWNPQACAGKTPTQAGLLLISS